MDRIASSRIRNLPPYLFQDLNLRKIRARQEGRDIIDLGMGNPDLPPPAPIIEKVREAAADPRAHRYSASRGIPHLRREICAWYRRKYGVTLDPDEEAVACIGSKEGISHLALAIFDRGDVVLVPNPTYPSHFYSCVIAGASVCDVPLRRENGFLPDFSLPIHDRYPGPKALIVSYPNNPTAAVAPDLSFFKEVVRFARQHNLLVIHDLAYAEICYDGYRAPSILQVDGARDVAVEFTSLSKTYNMAGWRVGFMAGNRHVVKALAFLKSYYDYGVWTPLQVAAICALRLEQRWIDETVAVYRKRRDVLVAGLNRVGWKVEKPLATMYVWAEIPERFRKMGSMDFSVHLLEHAGVAVSAGAGFGRYGEGFVRIALVENEQRIRQAVRNIGALLGPRERASGRAAKKP